MIILDTNILSAVMQEQRDRTIVRWLDRQAWESIWTTAITVFEIRLGLSILAKGRRRVRLEKAFQQVLDNILEGRILPFDEDAALAAGELAAERQRRGLTVDMRDTQIAGIAIAKRSTLATRNVKDFRDIAVPVVNPWEEG
ncbi:MAG: type II toxin-antitoxin system VapC family toxin [Nitrospirae bacterium]|nr:MAG: type II toxin-antitoxin system VapC family toxin [Nitrospirota bacterium]